MPDPRARNSDAPGALRVLIVDDEPDVRLGLSLLVASLGAEVRTAASGDEALAEAARRPPHLVLTDVTMPGMSGMELLGALRARPDPPEVVLITGFGTIEMAVAAMQRGAAHFVTKPFDNAEILDTVRRVGRQALLAARLRAAGGAALAGGTLIAEDPRMRAVLALVAQVAPTAMNVLIQGESGTGKELVARALHAQSPNCDRPFLAVNTAALPDPLLESELFGHRRGAFTGADRDRDGLFAEARGGTVFLDEIGLMSGAFQGKLLRVLQERTVIPLGSAQAVPVDFRLVAATSRDLRARCDEGEFREDLLYRMRVVTVEVPPLRARPGDVVPLAAHFLARYAPQVRPPGAPEPRFGPGVLEALERAPWPGNVRELENCLQRALVLAGGGELRVAHLGLEPEAPWPGGGEAPLAYEEAKQQAVERFQRQFLERALLQAEGNVTRAAELCGLTRAALQRIMRTLGLERDDFRRE